MNDPDISELKELVQRDLKLTADTNKMVRDMRRSARWGLMLQIIYWLLIFGVLGAAYFYVSPYITELLGFYRDLRAQNMQSYNIVESLFQTVGKYAAQGTTTPR